nr:reverse transcriptase domain-containing protein [Tanacetum cinerariifolium]
RSNRRHIQNIVKPEFRAIENIVPMADRTMEELLQAPTEGYREEIVIPEILAENFEIKTDLLQLVQANKFYGFERDNPHTHISNFKRMTATLKYRDVPNDAIKLMLFPYSLEGAARVCNPSSVCAASGSYNQISPPNRASHQIPPHGFAPVQNNPNSFFQNQPPTSGSLPSNTIPNPKGKMKAVTNRSDLAYEGPSIPTESSLEIIDERNTEEILDKEQSNSQEGWRTDPTRMTFELEDRSITRPKGVTEDVFVMVGMFHFPTDFVVVNFEADPRVPLILGRSFLRTGRALIDVYREEITLRDVLDFQYNPKSSSPTLVFDDLISENDSIPNNQIPPNVPNEFSSYIKSNEIAIKTMQNQINVLRGDFIKQEENLRRNLNDDIRNILSSFFQNQPSTLGTLSSNTIPNPKGEMKAVTTRSGLAYEGPSIPTESPLEKVDEQNTEEILDKDHSNSSGSTAQIQPLVVPILIPEPDVLRTQSKPSIPYLSRLNDQKLREKATNQMEKFFQIFHDLHFDISFADALLLMPKFASTIKSLLANKDKLFELAKVSLNENCSDMLLKKLPEKLGDPELTPTRMTLELADKSITRPKGVAEDVFVKVGKFHFPTDFVVVDFEVDPRVPLILRRSFLKTGRALIDVYGEEITLRVNDESITFNLNQTMRYSSTCDDTLVNRVDVIDVVYEDFVQDVLDFQYNPKSSSPTLVSDDLISESDSSKVPIVKSSSPTLTPFGESDFFLEEIEDFLNDDSIPTRIENSAYDPEGDILFLVKLLNEDPFQLPPMDLKVAEESKEKSSIEEHPKLELKELPSHLEYAFL